MGKVTEFISKVRIFCGYKTFLAEKKLPASPMAIHNNDVLMTDTKAASYLQYIIIHNNRNLKIYKI